MGSVGEKYIDGRTVEELDYSQYDGFHAPPVAPLNTARIYFDNGLEQLMLSENYGAYQAFLVGALTGYVPYLSTTLTPSQAVVTDAHSNLTTLQYSYVDMGNSLVERDSAGNASFNNFVGAVTQISSSNQTIAMTYGSSRGQEIYGTQNVTFKLPDSTYLYQGEEYHFNNNSTGIITVYLHDGVTLVGTVPSMSYAFAVCDNNTTVNGEWDIHYLLPSTNSYVPYTGATSDVDLGSHNLTTTGNVYAGGVSAGPDTTQETTLVVSNGNNASSDYFDPSYGTLSLRITNGTTKSLVWSAGAGFGNALSTIVGSWDANAASYLSFMTRPASTLGPVERLRIDADGNFDFNAGNLTTTGYIAGPSHIVVNDTEANWDTTSALQVNGNITTTGSIYADPLITGALEMRGQYAATFSSNTGNYLSIPNGSGQYDFGTNDFTLSWWSFKSSYFGNGDIFFAAGSYPGMWLNLPSSGAVYMSSDGANYDIAAGRNSFVEPFQNIWYHLAITRVGSTFTAYTNGVQTDQWTSALPIYGNATPINLGGTPYEQSIDGQIEEFEIYNVGLSSTQVASLYNNGAGYYGTGAETGIIGGWHLSEQSANPPDFVAGNYASWNVLQMDSLGKYMKGNSTYYTTNSLSMSSGGWFFDTQLAPTVYIGDDYHNVVGLVVRNINGDVGMVATGNDNIESVRNTGPGSAGAFWFGNRGTYGECELGMDTYGIQAFQGSSGTAAGYFANSGSGGAPQQITLANGTYAVHANGESYFYNSNGSADIASPYNPAFVNISCSSSYGYAINAVCGSGPEAYIGGQWYSFYGTGGSNTTILNGTHGVQVISGDIQADYGIVAGELMQYNTSYTPYGDLDYNGSWHTYTLYSTSYTSLNNGAILTGFAGPNVSFGGVIVDDSAEATSIDPNYRFLMGTGGSGATTTIDYSQGGNSTSAFMSFDSNGCVYFNSTGGGFAADFNTAIEFNGNVVINGGASSVAIGYNAVTFGSGSQSVAIGWNPYAPNSNEINFSTDDSTYGIGNTNGGYTQLDIYNGVADFQNNNIRVGGMASGIGPPATHNTTGILYTDTATGLVYVQ